MKKNTLNTAVLASLAGVAGIANISNAVYVNADGTGQVLLYPYYTAQRDNQTLLSVVNTTSLGKAVKVRILEGRNSREVLDFNLFLSPEDVWTAAILSTSALTGGASDSGVAAGIGTYDQSCTFPSVKSARSASLTVFPFFNFAYAGSNNDSGPTSLDRTREGHIELIEMLSIGPGAVLNSIVHSPTTGSPTCSNLPNASITAAAGSLPPSGGLFGGIAILDIKEGSYINYSATALEDFSTAQNLTSADSINPNLTNLEIPRSDYFVNGALVRSNWGINAVDPANPIGQKVDAISSLFMSDTLVNEWSTERSLDASSEWVITFPTKRFYVDLPGTTALAPFTQLFRNGAACEELTFKFWDREEFSQQGTVGFSPPPPTPSNSLCYETNVLTFNQNITFSPDAGSSATRTLRSGLGRNLNPVVGTSAGTSQAGWLRVTLGLNGTVQRRMRPSTQGHINVGLPAQGFWALQVLNTNVAAGQAPRNYGGAYDVKRTRVCGTTTVAGGVLTPGCPNTP
jgi:hypothetical protein